MHIDIMAVPRIEPGTTSFVLWPHSSQSSKFRINYISIRELTQLYHKNRKREFIFLFKMWLVCPWLIVCVYKRSCTRTYNIRDSENRLRRLYLLNNMQLSKLKLILNKIVQLFYGKMWTVLRWKSIIEKFSYLQKQ